MALWKLLSNWKTVIAYLLMNIPGLTAYPMLKDALDKVLMDPSRQNIINLVIQVLLVTGIAHRVMKNLNKAA